MTKRALNLLVLVLVFAACASQREKTLKATFVTINAARAGFVAHDEAQQAAIVAKAAGLEDGKTQLAAYRLARLEVVEAFELAYQTLTTAVFLSDDLSLKNAAKALANLLATAKRVTVP